MIKESMFYGKPKLTEYSEMDIPSIIREYLLSRGGTRGRDLDGRVIEMNHAVSATNLVSSGLFLYGLKANTTNKRAVIYYSERWARKNNLMDGNKIRVPSELWEECDKKNEEFTMGNDRKPLVDNEPDATENNAANYILVTVGIGVHDSEIVNPLTIQTKAFPSLGKANESMRMQYEAEVEQAVEAGHEDHLENSIGETAASVRYGSSENAMVIEWKIQKLETGYL